MNKSALHSIAVIVALVASAGISACDNSHAASNLAAAPAALAAAPAAAVSNDSRMAPRAPFDTTSITTMETVAASDR